MPDPQPERSPRILEIGPTPFLHAAFPESTDFYSTWLDETTANASEGRRIVTMRELPGLARRLRDRSYDIVAVHALPYSPWSPDALVRAIFRRSALRGSIPLVRQFGHQLLRGTVGAPIAIVDFEDSAVIDRANAFLWDKAAAYFKRELPADHWQVFSGTFHRRLPTRRFREVESNDRRIKKLAPIALGIEVGAEERSAHVMDAKNQKVIDVFFAGRIRGSSTVRSRGMQELEALREEGYTIDVPDEPVSKEEFFARCARAWIVWSPAGYGWQCFRTWEAALCGSVPLTNRPVIEQYRPLAEGEHALYYDVEPGGLSHAIKSALADKNRLLAMADASRAYVLQHHSRKAIARYVVETTLQRAPGSADS